MKFRTPYNYVPEKGVENNLASMTQQQFKRECDINSIMDKYYRTGCFDIADSRPMSYGDYSNLGDYQENMNKIVEARQMFEALPSRVRERFGNNPANLIEFVMDDSNRDEAIKLGLIEVDNSVTTEAVAEVDSATDGSVPTT